MDEYQELTMSRYHASPWYKAFKRFAEQEMEVGLISIGEATAEASSLQAYFEWCRSFAVERPEEFGHSNAPIDDLEAHYATADRQTAILASAEAAYAPSYACSHLWLLPEGEVLYWNNEATPEYMRIPVARLDDMPLLVDYMKLEETDDES